MKAIVTGSNGLLGSAIKNELGENHIYLTREICNLVHENHVNNCFLKIYSEHSKEQPDTIIHCAAKVGGVQANMDNNKGFFLTNIAIDNNVIKAALSTNCKNVVTILSTCIFPNKNITYPLTANQINNGAPHPSNHGYAYAKRLLHYTTEFAREVTGNNWISIVPTNIYGENDFFSLRDGHLIPALIRKGYEASLTGGDFVVWGDGSPLRQFIYSKDLAKVILWAIDNWKVKSPMMAVNEKEYSIKEVASIIAERFNIPEKRIKYDTSKPNGQFRKPAATDISNDFKLTPLDEGINKTIDWFTTITKDSNEIRLSK